MKSFKDDHIQIWFDQSLDISSRTLFMGSIGKTHSDEENGVDHLMTEIFIKGMHLLERKSPEQEITIIMNNPGGDWYHGMAIYDSIYNSSCPCTVKVYGYAMSMGSIILQAATRRIMMPSSRFMIHYGYNGSYGHSKIFEKWADEGKKTSYEMENIYLERMLQKSIEVGKAKYAKILSDIVNRTKLLEIPSPDPVSYQLSRYNSTRREELRSILRGMLNFDTILSPTETVDLGFADEVFTK